MSDEEVLGTVCYIPSRIYVMMLALGFTAYGASNWLYYMIFFYRIEGHMTPTHCSGSRCDDIISCDATRRSSYEIYQFIVVFGSLIFGLHGINALMNKYPGDTFNFGCWLIAFVALCAFITLMDFAYTVACDSYSYNVISEVIFWPTPHLLVNEGVKYEIRQLNTYPRVYINALAGLRVFLVYVFMHFVKMVFFIHGAWVTIRLAQRFHYGVAGMGANFSIEGWQKRLQAREEVSQVAQNTWDMAVMSALDLDWDKEDFQMRRPLRNSRHWYRGFVPGAAARAYDGFRDDRRNVLL